MWPTPWIFLTTALVIPASLLVFLPINVLAGYISAAALYVGTLAVLLTTSPIVEVTEDHLIAGRAQIALAHVGQAQAFRTEEATLERGQRLDARAWLVIRGWISPVVKIQVTDPSDPTPYWLVSSRHPDQVVDALTKAIHSFPSKNRG